MTTTYFNPTAPALPETVEQARRARADFKKYVDRAADAERRLTELQQAAQTVCTGIYSQYSDPAHLILAIRELAILIGFEKGENENGNKNI